MKENELRSVFECRTMCVNRRGIADVAEAHMDKRVRLKFKV